MPKALFHAFFFLILCESSWLVRSTRCRNKVLCFPLPLGKKRTDSQRKTWLSIIESDMELLDGFTSYDRRWESRLFVDRKAIIYGQTLLQSNMSLDVETAIALGIATRSEQVSKMGFRSFNLIPNCFEL